MALLPWGTGCSQKITCKAGYIGMRLVAWKVYLRTMCALCQQSHWVSAQVTERFSWVSGFHPRQIHKVGAGNWGKRRVGFNQRGELAKVSHCLRTEHGKFTMANSNPQVFRLNLLNFLNAAPRPCSNAPTRHNLQSQPRSPLPPKTNFHPHSKFTFDFSQAEASWYSSFTIQKYSGYSIFEMANLGMRAR